MMLASTAARADLDLVIVSMQGFAESVADFGELSAYLSKSIGEPVQIRYSGGFDASLALKDPNSFDVLLTVGVLPAGSEGLMSLARVPGRLRYLLVTRPELGINLRADLVGRRVACPCGNSPESGAIDEFFPNPLRQPAILHTASGRLALRRLADALADAAIVPAPIARAAKRTGQALKIVAAASPVGHVSVYAGAGLSAARRQAVAQAFAQIDDHASVRSVLMQLNIPGFVKVDSKRQSPELYSQITAIERRSRR